MTGKDIRVQAQLHCDLNIESPYAIRYINEAINQLALEYDTAMNKGFTTITVDNVSWNELPKDVVVIKKVTRDNTAYNSFIVDGNMIRFYDIGTYEIEYLKMPTPLTTETDEPDINSLYHYAIALFVASRERSRLFSDEDNDCLRLMSEFVNNAAKVNVRLSSQKKTRRIIKMPEW